MTIRFLAATVTVLLFGPVSPLEALAASKSCSGFAVIKSHDAAASSIELSFQKGSQQKFFPRPSGGPSLSKLPKKCRSKVTKLGSFPVKPVGGRMSITQVRQNFSGKMLNDIDDPDWVPAQLATLIAEKTRVAVVIRPGLAKDSPLGVTTIYLPVTEEELAEIERLENTAVDVD